MADHEGKRKAAQFDLSPKRSLDLLTQPIRGPGFESLCPPS
jgi:hypothetical protein